MKIENAADYENFFLEKFGDISKSTLSSLKSQRVRFNLGEELEDEYRFQQALNRSTSILDDCFSGKDIWLRIIMWGENGLHELKSTGMDLDIANEKIEGKEGGYDVLYLYYERYSFQIISPVVASIINYELARDPSAHITCYFVNFYHPVVVNIYDDRGCDIYSPNNSIILSLAQKHKNWINKAIF